MLDVLLQRSLRLFALLSAPLVAVVALSSTSCAALYSGRHSTHVSFPVVPSNGAFGGWTEIKVGADVNSVGFSTLTAVILTVDTEKTPPGIQDLSFFQSLTGTVIGANGESTKVASGSDFRKGDTSVILENDYLGDLRPLFKTDGRTIHIDWAGTMNPAFTNWPAGGIWVKAEVVVDIQ